MIQKTVIGLFSQSVNRYIDLFYDSSSANLWLKKRFELTGYV